MKHESKFERAVKLLKIARVRVEEAGNGKYTAIRHPLYCMPQWDADKPPVAATPMTKREIIKMAEYLTNECKQKTSIKKNVKAESKSERAFVRDNIRVHGEDADTNYPKTKFSDVWSWD